MTQRNPIHSETHTYKRASMIATETSPLLLPGAAIPRGNGVFVSEEPHPERDSEESSVTLGDERLGGDGGENSDGSWVDVDAANQSVGTARAVLIILSLWVLIFLQASNMSGLTTTQSTIAADLDAFSEASWFTSAYLIGASSVAPLAGRLAQIFSARKCIFASSVFFVLGGLVTSQAISLPIFLLGRVISGVGAAGIMTISIILVLELTGRKRRGLFIGMANAGYTSGVALGAVLAGALLPVCGWRVLFGAQVPLAFLAGTAIFYSIPKSFTSGPQSVDKETIKSKLAKLDYSGAVLLTSSIVSFLYGLASPQIEWIPIMISPILLATFVLNEIYFSREPIIPIVVLKSRGVLLTCLAQLGVMAARWMVLFYTPVYAIAVRGWAPAAAGSILIPSNLGFGIGGLLVGWLHIRRAGSFYLPCILSFALFTTTLFLLSQFSTSSFPVPLYILLTFLNGLCTGAALNYTLTHLLHLSFPSTHFIVTAMLATFRGFGASFGSAIGGGIFSRILKQSLISGFRQHGIWDSQREELVRKLLGSPALVQSLVGKEKEVAVQGYVIALRGLFLCGVLLAAAMVLVQAGTGWRNPSDKGEVHMNGNGNSGVADQGALQREQGNQDVVR